MIPIKEIIELQANGKKNGNSVKKTKDPNISGYCVAGLARAPPINDPTIVPVENRNPNVLNSN
jgi:hypothetical protein